jgi:hypothetical protein
VSLRRLVALYPAAWRHRYGAEFLALLEDRPPRLRDAVDIAWGAIDAHCLGQLPDGRSGMFMRFTGLTAIFAGVALLLTFIPSQVALEGWGTAPTIGYTLFYPLALFGSFGIHLRLTRVRPNLAWPAFAAMAFGCVGGSSSLQLSMWGGGIPSSDFGVWQGIGLWVGSAVMGAAVLVIGVVPRFVGLAFILGSALAMIGPIAGDALTSSGILTALSRSGVVIYATGWILAGTSLQFAASVSGDSLPPTAGAPSPPR